MRDITFRGSRIGVLLFHGLTGTPTEMAHVAKGLNQYGFTVTCPVLPGHCMTESELLATNWHDWVEGTRRSLEEMREQTDVVFVGGLSAGAVLALHLAALEPNIRGTSMYSTTLKWDGWTITKWAFLLPLVLRLPYIGPRYHFPETFPYGIKNERLRQRIVHAMQSGNAEAAGLNSTPGYSLRELWRLVDVLKKEMPSIKTPTLLVHSDHDDVADIRNARYVYKHLGGPRTLIPLHNSYHMITVDQEYRTVVQATAQYFMDYLSKEEKAELSRCAMRSFEKCELPDAEVISV